MKKALPVVFGFLLIAGVAGILYLNAKKNEQTAVRASTSVSGKPIIKIGVVTPMSGDMGQLCKEMWVVMQSRIVQLNANPNNKYEYKILFEDSRWEPKTGYMAAKKLVSVDKVDALIPIASMVAKVTIPLVERANIPQLSLAYEECADGKYCFNYYLASADIAALEAKAMHAMDIKSFAYLGENQEALLKSGNDMEAAAKLYGIQYKGHFFYNDDEVHDYRMHLLKARETGAELFFFVAPPPAVDILFRQAKQLGGFDKITAVETLEHVQDKKDYLEGVWLAGCPPFTGRLKEALLRCGVESPKIQFTLYAYDLPEILVRAFESAGDGKTKPSCDKVCEALRQMKTIQTLLGSAKLDERGTFHPSPVLVYYGNGVGREVSLDELKKLKGIK